MGGQIAVAEAEPVGLHAVGGEFLLGMPGFVAMPPAALGVDAAAQGVHAGVEVRADPHAEHPGVVADVDDRGQFVYRIATRRRTGPSPSRCCTPSRKRAPPTPPTRTVTFTSTDIRPSGPSDRCGRRVRTSRLRDTPTSPTRRIPVTEWYEFLFQRLTPAANACVITSVSFRGWPAGFGVADRDSITCSN